jgi:putative transcription antitermination factor YqgF
MIATRILGIDYGTKRIGVAISDIGAQFGQPHSVIKNSKTKRDEVLAKILEIVKAEQVTEIVLGESKDFKGQDNTVMPDIRDFKKSLENALATLPTPIVPIVFEPEFLTSYQAEYFQGKHDLLDASAAALILQSYLDKKKNQGEASQKEQIKEEQAKKEQKTVITIDDFSKVETRAGKILKAEPIPGSSKLLKLEVDFGEAKPRQVLSGIAKYFPDTTTLIGRTVGFVTNLEPRFILGLESQAMILAVSTPDGIFSLLSIDPTIPSGTKVK